MSPAFARALDEATIALLEETSHAGDPRTYLVDCAACGQPFWLRRHNQRYCASGCQYRARDRRRRRHQEADP